MIKDRLGRTVVRILAVHPNGRVRVDLDIPDTCQTTVELRLADLTGPSPDWGTQVTQLLHVLRLARSCMTCRCPIARAIARGTVRRAVAGLRHLTGRRSRRADAADAATDAAEYSRGERTRGPGGR